MTAYTAKPGFTIEIDDSRELISVRLWGLWDLPIVEEYIAQIRAAGSATPSSSSASQGYLIVVDARDHAVQTKEVVERFQSSLGELIHAYRRLAVVTHSVVKKMQAERIGVANMRVFGSKEVAIEWLLSADPLA